MFDRIYARERLAPIDHLERVKKPNLLIYNDGSIQGALQNFT
jgi:hypothetical protein